MPGTIRSLGVTIGQLPTGPLNCLGDVPGVTVGHATLDTPAHKTGVTIVLPAQGNLFARKLVGAGHVFNGFGKTLGLMQLAELGTIETPIALTNTLNVGLVHDALVQYMLDTCAADGVPLFSVNPIVCECNDAGLNAIHDRAITRAHVFSAIADARADFAQGCVGAGAGTICHGLKGGIGSASRVMEIGGRAYTLGALVQSNHGLLPDLLVGGKPWGQALSAAPASPETDKGSCILIIGTDLPLSDRQLLRVIRRAQVGLARLGSFIGHGSGEVAIGFTTAGRIRHQEEDAVVQQSILNENLLDTAFRACAESCEEAILNSLAAAVTTTGNGKTVRALRDMLAMREGEV